MIRIAASIPAVDYLLDEVELEVCPIEGDRKRVELRVHHTANRGRDREWIVDADELREALDRATGKDPVR